MSPRKKDAEKKTHKPKILKLKSPKPNNVSTPKPNNVSRFIRSISRHRDKMEEIVAKRLRKYHIAGTNTESYWKLAAYMILLGREYNYLSKKG